MIHVEQLGLHVGAFVLEKISFSIPTAQYGVLMGKTGCGKTTLLEAICGLKRVRTGSIQLMGRDVTRLKPAERGVGYVPQDLALFPNLTVREHLAFALDIRGWPRTRLTKRVAELSELLGLQRLLERRPHGLSGGEAQRVALGRALSFEPSILLLDEPLSALDDETRAEMYTLLRAVQHQTRVTTLHITHSLSEAQALADRLLLLRDGVVTEAAPPPTQTARTAMLVEVHYMAQLKLAAGVGSEKVEVASAATVADLIANVAARRAGKLTTLLLDAHGSVQPTVLVFVGDAQVEPSQTLLHEGDIITLLSPIAGGSR